MVNDNHRLKDTLRKAAFLSFLSEIAYATLLLGRWKVYLQNLIPEPPP